MTRATDPSRRVVTCYEVWVLWFRGYYGSAYVLAIAIAGTHTKELLVVENLLLWLAFVAIATVFAGFIEWTFRAFRFARIRTDFASTITIENHLFRETMTMEEFCRRVVRVPNGISLQGHENQVFISRRHVALSRLLARCEVRA